MITVLVKRLDHPSPPGRAPTLAGSTQHLQPCLPPTPLTLSPGPAPSPSWWPQQTAQPTPLYVLNPRPLSHLPTPRRHCRPRPRASPHASCPDTSPLQRRWGPGRPSSGHRAQRRPHWGVSGVPRPPSTPALPIPVPSSPCPAPCSQSLVDYDLGTLDSGREEDTGKKIKGITSFVNKRF